MCQKKNILVVADEIMCGLGRHGQTRQTTITSSTSPDYTPTLFLSEAWDLPVDALTFGKAICAGVFPMSGVLCRRGASKVVLSLLNTAVRVSVSECLCC